MDSHPKDPKPATAHTVAANRKVLTELDFGNTDDLRDANRGFLGGVPDGRIAAPDGSILLELNNFRIDPDTPAPDTVNPSLWRVVALNGEAGLYEVTDGIYQLRGLDLANMTVVEGEYGIIVIDVLTNAPAAKAALDLYYHHRGRRPVQAVIYTHSHTDHFGGVTGIVTAEDVSAGKVRVLAPAGFTEETLKESLYAGTAMNRRATYMYAPLLPHGQQPGQSLGAGPGIALPMFPPSFIEPTDLITHTGQTVTLDGVEFEFLMAPGSEAPAEMLIYLPSSKAICAADVVLHSLHNLYTLRGAKTRDALLWIGYLNEVLERWGDEAEVLFIQHQWPVWGNADIQRFLTDYRDVLKFIHDRTLHLANRGHTLAEVGEDVVLPPELAQLWPTRGHYGTVSHNARAVYNFYLGFFGGDPAELNPLPPRAAAARYVAVIGGADAVVDHAQRAFDEGEYRWAAELLQHVVYAEPSHDRARYLQADTFEQLGYQAEAGTWRNFYHVGAHELRHGAPELHITGPDPLALSPTLPIDGVFDYLGIAIDSDKAAGMDITVDVVASDTGERRSVTLRRQVLNATRREVPDPDATITGSLADLCAVLLGDESPRSGNIDITGDPGAIEQLLSVRTAFPMFFPIVTRPAVPG